MSLLESCHFLFLSPLFLFTCCCQVVSVRSWGLVLYLHYLHSTCDTFSQILMYHSFSQRNDNQTDSLPSENVKNTLPVLPLPTLSWLLQSWLLTSGKITFSCISHPWILYRWLTTAGHTQQLRTKGVTCFSLMVHDSIPHLSAATPSWTLSMTISSTGSRPAPCLRWVTAAACTPSPTCPSALWWL